MNHQPNVNPRIFLVALAVFVSLLALWLFYWQGYHVGFLVINSFGLNLPDVLIQCITVLGDASVTLSLFWLCAFRHPRMLACGMLAAIVMAIVIHLIKDQVGALRPASIFSLDAFRQSGELLKKSSFPSGHTATFVTLMTLVVLQYRYLWVYWVCLLLAIIVGLSRVWVGAHWPIDLLVGASIGIIVVLIVDRHIDRYPQLFSTYIQKSIHLLLLLNTGQLFFRHLGYPDAKWFVILIALMVLIINSYWFYQDKKRVTT